MKHLRLAKKNTISLALALRQLLAGGQLTAGTDASRNGRLRLPRAPVACNEENGLAAANESLCPATFSVLDGGDLVVPYGEYPQEILLSAEDARTARALGHQVAANGAVIAVQVMDNQAAMSMANDLASLGRKITTLFRGLPIYNGHPYHPDPARRSNYPDKRAYGWSKAIEATNDGMRIAVDYNQLGTEAVNDAQLVYHSPQWKMELLPIQRGEPIRCRPFRLISIGLTNEPNIPVPAIVAANESEQPPALESQDQIQTPPANAMFEAIKKALIEAGLIKPEDTDDAIMAAIASLIQDITWSRERKKQDEMELAKISAACGESATSAAANDRLALLDKLIAKAGTADVIAANAKASRDRFIGLSLDDLIITGRISKAEADQQRPTLVEAANDTDVINRLDALTKLAPKWQTQAKHAASLGGAKKEVIAANNSEILASKRAAAQAEALQEITKGKPAKAGDVEKAWNLARQRNPSIF